MSDHIESGLPLASTQPEGSNPSPLRRKHRKDSQSSDERIAGTKSASSRRRPGTRKEVPFGPHVGGESSTMQPSMSPDTPTVHYTRTGRISKAKKGLKVHNCECGRSYTRAEHLRRHQKNHAQDALVCKFPECGKTFFRVDLLQRHEERHNDTGNDSRRTSLFSQGTNAEVEAQVSAPVPLATPIVTSALPSASPYYQPVSPLPESTSNPRYTSNQFRTPQIPSSAFGHIRSSPISTNHVKQPHRPPYSRGGQTVQIPVDGLQGGVSWTDPFSQSPGCSSSSGYASPIPGAGDYANMFANPPYGRTRTSSNASFIEPWGFPSRSPTSATSTMAAYTWTSSDKGTTPANLAYMTNTSYPMTNVPMSAGVDPVSSYGHFGPKTMAQRDEEEQAFLFPEQSFGMGQTSDTYLFDKYLDNYWRLFHPSFPVVHRATFDDGINESPMLRAAMIAVGAQYSNDPIAKRKARILHDRCRKLLDKREFDLMTEPDRLCDYQALFLYEVLSQYRARRVANTLSIRFETLYQDSCQNYQNIASGIVDSINSVLQRESVTYENWKQWIVMSSRQRLLLCCYILEYQQATLLARAPQASLIQVNGFELPFPSHSALWDAMTLEDWAIAAQQYPYPPTYVYQITPGITNPLDHFQSLLLVAAHYNHFSNPAPCFSPPTVTAIGSLFDSSPITKHHLLTAKLLQVTPIRALLAVSGESWILSEKVPSAAAFSSLKATLKAWVSGLWASPADTQDQTVKDALRLSIELVQHAIMTPAQTLHLELGADMGLYFASLIIWAVTVAANTRINTPQVQIHQIRFPSHSPLPSNRNSSHYPSTPTHIPGSPSQATSPSLAHPTGFGFISSTRTSPTPALTSISMSYSDITMKSLNFINTAFMDLELLDVIPQWPQEIAQWQQGSAALMRWVKMRLRNGDSEGQDTVVAPGPTSAVTSRGGDGLGELLDGVISVLEKVMGRGWDGWMT